MAVIWYTIHVDHDKIMGLLPSPNLSSIFDDWKIEYVPELSSDEESEINSDLESSSSD